MGIREDMALNAFGGSAGYGTESTLASNWATEDAINALTANSSGTDWLNLLGTGAGAAYGLYQGSQAGKDSPQLAEALAMLLGEARAGAGEWSKSAAKADSKDAVAALFRDYKQTALPKIYGAQTQTGGYGSTGAQLLANDAFASATAKAAQLQQATISDYAKNRQQQLQVLAGLLGTQTAGKPKAATATATSGSGNNDLASLLQVGSQLFGLL